MICPFCGAEQSVVVNSRQVKDARRRRYECVSCQERYSTIEMVETDAVLDKRIAEEMKEAKKLQQIFRSGDKRIARIITLLELEEKWSKK